MTKVATKQGYAPLYDRDGANRCPSCGDTRWHVGRFSAECASCGTALSLGPLKRPSAALPAPPAWGKRL